MELIVHETTLDPEFAPFVEDRVNRPGEASNYLSYCEAEIADSRGSLKVAELDSCVVGFLCWINTQEGPYVQEEFRNVGEVLFVVVSKSHRGKGIGLELMREAERLTHSAGLKRLSLMVMAGNSQAVGLYQKMGYRTRAFKMLKKLP